MEWCLVALIILKLTFILKAIKIPPNGLGSNKVQINVTTLLEWPNTQTFLSDYAKPSRPFIVKGAAASWPAFHQWTDENFLDSKKGVEEIVIVEQAKKENRDLPGIEKSFHEFVRDYQQRDWYLVNNVPDFLRKDVIMPPVFQCPLLADLLLDQKMWFSSGGTKSVLHYDSMENIHCLVAGTKLFVLIHKDDKVDIDQPHGVYSSVDADNVDYTKYPDLASVEYHLAHLSAGDCLYLPYHWYHQVRAVDRNIGINMWWDHHSMITMDGSECEHASGPKTMADVQFHGTAKLLENQQAVKSHLLMLASQGGSPFTLERLLFMFLGDEKHRPKEDQQVENEFKLILDTLDQNQDGKVGPIEVESLSQQKWGKIQQSLQDVEKYFGDKSENFDTQDEAVPHDWDDAQYEGHDEVFLDDMDYMDFHTDWNERDEL